MNERNYKTIAIILTIMLVFNSWQLIQVKQELSNLTYEYNHTLASIQNNIRNIENGFSQQYNRIDELLTEQASLFSETGISMKLAGNQIAVTMTAVPKELANNETLTARITAGEKIYEQPVNANGSTTILIDPAEYIKPCFVIQSPSGIRQQTLGDVYTMNALNGYVHSSWEDTAGNSSDMVLGIYLPDMKGQPFTADEIAEVACIVVNTGEKGREGTGENAIAAIPEAEAVYMGEPEQLSSPDAIPEGEEYIAVKQADSTADEPHYQADFLDRYSKLEDNIRYNVYLVITTTDGMRFATTGSRLADFWYADKHSSAGAYDTALFPISLKSPMM